MLVYIVNKLKLIILSMMLCVIVVFVDILLVIVMCLWVCVIVILILWLIMLLIVYFDVIIKDNFSKVVIINYGLILLWEVSKNFFVIEIKLFMIMLGLVIFK